MRRLLYLSTLLALQLALIVLLAPPIAHALRVDAAPGTAPSGVPALLQLVATGAAVAGASLALAFPGIALARHRRDGPHRFAGIPRFAVTLALAGTATLAAGAIAWTAAPMLPAEAGMTSALVARPVVAAGLALATAGALCAELLRRSIASAHAAAVRPRGEAARVEVTHPPELRTLEA